MPDGPTEVNAAELARWLARVERQLNHIDERLNSGQVVKRDTLDIVFNNLTARVERVERDTKAEMGELKEDARWLWRFMVGSVGLFLLRIVWDAVSLARATGGGP